MKILVDPDGVPVHDIDAAGVKRCHRPDVYNSECIRSIIMEEWDKLPFLWPVGGSVPGFSFKRSDFFTYWDDEHQMYVWKSMNKHSWMCGGWREHFAYYPDINILEDIFSLDKQWLPWKEVGTLSKWINGIEWKTVWSRMNEIRTGRYEEAYYEGGDGLMNRSRETNYYPSTQIPLMRFFP